MFKLQKMNTKMLFKLVILLISLIGILTKKNERHHD